MTRDYRKELNDVSHLIGEYFVIDPEGKKVGKKEVKHWNTSLATLTYALDKNALIVGEPGFAKTTGVKVLSSMLSGFPLDLYEAAQIQGHPDQTYETMIARLDFSKLKEEESVIWLLSAYLPVKVIDEINRLPPGNQDELLNTLQTGRFNYLNSTLFTGVTPFYATANHPDDGNHVLIPPMRDRFTIHFEMGHIGATYRSKIKVGRENINELLTNSEISGNIINIINNSKYSVKEKLEQIDAARLDFVANLESDNVGVKPFYRHDVENIQSEVENIPLSTEADILIEIIDKELNYTPTFGRKRSSDRIDSSNHAKKLASSSAKNAFSPRAAIDGLELMSKGVAYLLADKEVRKEHLRAVAPHVLGHRLEFTPDFAAAHEGTPRAGLYGCSKEMHLSQMLIKGVEKNYESVKKDLDLVKVALHNPEDLSKENRERANNMLKDHKLLDHPLLKEYIHRLKKNRTKF
tara:strand:- start:11496 stop:12887 length:1392 start_codon:yes stop_codon:yes gene_type:complete